MKIDVAGLSMIVGAVIAVLVPAITKLRAPAKLKAALTAVLSAAAGIVANLAMTDGSAVVSWQTLCAAFLAYVMAFAAHHGITLPFNLPEKLAPNSGLGTAAQHRL